MTFDRDTIGAFVDGELNEIERRRVEAALATDPELARRVQAERRLRGLLKARFDPVAEEAVPERLIATVRDNAAVAWLPPRRAWGASQWAAVAAALAIGIATGQMFRSGSEIVERGGALAASGGLADALELQLASARDPDNPVRIGLTFKARDGAWCRTFERATLNGIACRAADGWRIRRIVTSPAPATEYRQAGASELAAAAQDMAAGTPLDAEQERALIGAHWNP